MELAFLLHNFDGLSSSVATERASVRLRERGRCLPPATAAIRTSMPSRWIFRWPRASARPRPICYAVRAVATIPPSCTKNMRHPSAPARSIPCNASAGTNAYPPGPSTRRETASSQLPESTYRRCTSPTWKCSRILVSGSSSRMPAYEPERFVLPQDLLPHPRFRRERAPRPGLDVGRAEGLLDRDDGDVDESLRHHDPLGLRLRTTFGCLNAHRHHPFGDPTRASAPRP